VPVVLDAAEHSIDSFNCDALKPIQCAGNCVQFGRLMGLKQQFFWFENR
jgi:hypothetical protein